MGIDWRKTHLKAPASESEVRGQFIDGFPTGFPLDLVVADCHGCGETLQVDPMRGRRGKSYFPVAARRENGYSWCAQCASGGNA